MCVYIYIYIYIYIYTNIYTCGGSRDALKNAGCPVPRAICISIA